MMAVYKRNGIYSFVVGILLGIWLIPDTSVFLHPNGGVSEIELSLRSYSLKVIRFAISVSMLTLIITLLLGIFPLREIAQKPFVRDFAKGFIVVLGLILLFMVGNQLFS
ncbi:hypothetical protein [Paenibacillus sp. 1001270B_150601_E10]|uniref:hypothetical protein n=1 Tax=Paenibacillus sp. 1001270B_150601_E10 TaxID=2787079 RepID=UPI00189DD7B8|nr:hypothetical protein [Paenibacillus sp. 1001270B_150601_E10]